MRKDFGKKLEFFPLPVLIIATYDEFGNPNAMNAAWGGITDYNQISIALAKHKTTENLLKTGEFTLSFATKETVVISDYFGLVSGAKVDKIKNSGVHIEKSKNVNAPIILEYPLTLECKVLKYENEVLTADVVNMSVDEKYLNDDGTINVEKIGFIAYDSINSAYREVGPIVNLAFSCGKEIK